MLKTILFGFLALIAILALIPLFSSGDWKTSQSIMVDAKAAHIYKDVATPERWLEWSVWNRERDEKCDHQFSDPKTGAGATWIWKGTEPPEGLGEGTMLITKGDPQTGIQYELEFKGFPKMVGRIGFAEKDGKTEVSWTSSGSVGDSYLFKAINSYGLMTAEMKKEYLTSLTKLKERAEARATKASEPVEASAKKK